MKVAMINDSYYPYSHGGAESYIHSVSEALVKNYGYEIIIISTMPFKGASSLFPKKTELNERISVYRFYPLNLYHRSKQSQANKLTKIGWYVIDEANFHSYSIVTKILKKESPDLVHTHNLRGISPLIFKSVSSTKLPHVHTIHDVYLVSPGILPKDKVGKKFWSCYRNINKTLVTSPNLVISPSYFALQKYLKAGIFRDTPNLVLPNPPRFNLCPCRKTTHQMNITYVGSLTAPKGILWFLKAAEKITSISENRDIHFHIVGTGPLKEYIHSYITEKKINNIKLHGYQDMDQLIEIYKMSDIVVIPSIVSENMPQVIMESFAHSVPVIASAVGGIPEIVKHEYNGILINPSNPSELENAINEIVENRDIIKRLKKHALKTAEKYSLKNHVRKLNKKYLEVIN